MQRNRRSLLWVFIATVPLAFAQDAETGITVPTTLSGAFMKSDDPYFSYHAAAYPALRLDDHWYVYSAVDFYSTPFFYYPEYNDSREWAEVQLDQLFVARTWKGETSGWVVKAGKLQTAFGAPQRAYDDMQNPLLDQPLSLTSPLPLYTALSACPTGLCFNYNPDYNPWAPITLYGVWGAEFSGWWKQFDARLQLTNSSVANPLPLTSGNQHAQWTAGAGVAVAPGWRVGVSGFRGAWLDGGIASAAPPATGLGVDTEWARGRWKVRAEWQRLEFPYPAAFQTVVPTASFADAETKLIISPRWYAAVRIGYQRASGWGSASDYAPNLARYEAAVGFRPNRFQLIKVGYEWNRPGQRDAEIDNVLGVELVTSLPVFTRALR